MTMANLRRDTTARRGRRGPAGPGFSPDRSVPGSSSVSTRWRPNSGCSVTPVREALVTLRGEGLVKSSPHRGFIVDEPKRSDIVDIFWMQSQLSARLAVHAAANPDLPDCLADLTAIVDEFEGALAAGDGRRIMDSEYRFHRAIHLAADSKKLAWFLVAAARYTPYSLYSEDREWGRRRWRATAG